MIWKFKKDVKDERLVNSVKYHYYQEDSLKLVFKKFESKCKSKHKLQIKLSKIQTRTTDLTSSSQTQ